MSIPIDENEVMVNFVSRLEEVRYSGNVVFRFERVDKMVQKAPIQIVGKSVDQRK